MAQKERDMIEIDLLKLILILWRKAWAIILSAILLNESMDIYSMIGAVLVLGSTFVSELTERK